MAASLSALEARIAARPATLSLTAEAGTPASSEGPRVFLRSGATAVVVTQTWAREAQGAAIQTRITYVTPPDAEALTCVERFSVGAQQIEILLLTPDGLTTFRRRHWQT